MIIRCANIRFLNQNLQLRKIIYIILKLSDWNEMKSALLRVNPDLGIDVFHKSSEMKICESFQLLSRLSKLAIASRSIWVIIGLIFSLGANAQLDTLPVRLAGRIESVDSAYEVPYVHIINKYTGMGVISDSLGIFKTSLLINDTIIFRCLGFTDFIFTLPDSIPSSFFFVNVKLSPHTYKLAVIDVLALTRKSQFRYDFTNVEVDLQALEPAIIIPGVTNPNYKKLREAKRPIYPSYIGGALGFISKMQKKNKSLKKLAALYKEDEKEEITMQKYNLELLQTFTGYDGKKLMAFFIYLEFSVDYIYETNDYDIFLLINVSMSSFEKYYNEHGLQMDFIEVDSIGSN